MKVLYSLLKSITLYASLFCLALSNTSIQATPLTAPNLHVTTVLSKSWSVVEIGLIGTASLEILNDAISDARAKGYAGIVIVLDTPGGVLDTTREMVKKIMDSDLPIVVWVGPSAARAGSAGAFITIAGHVAAMAQGTNIGAAHPIDASGKDIENKELDRKIENDTVAFIESIATVRGRNKEMAASFVLNSVSLTAAEALEYKMIDLLADSPKDLMKLIHGREVQLTGNVTQVLDTQDATLHTYQRTLRQSFLEILSNPNLFYLLFIAGIIGIGFELTHPGSLVPGVVGSISLLLALMSSAVLPVNFAAVMLILAAVALIVAESFIPSFGALGIGGIIAFIIGSFLLIDPSNEQGLRISIATILPTAALITSFGVFVFYLVSRSQRQKEASSVDALIGKTAQVIEDFSNQKGQVLVDGELWSAQCPQGAICLRQKKVKITGREGLLLMVTPYVSDLDKPV